MEYPEVRLNLKLMSKARPRVTKNGTFMPRPYQEWRKECMRQMKEQWSLPPITTPIAVDILCVGTARGDIDNYLGAVLDCGNKIIWSDDRATIIQSASVTYRKAPEKESYWIINVNDIAWFSDRLQ
jgi:Holliday junction resolvase RusA-like endonuclease